MALLNRSDPPPTITRLWDSDSQPENHALPELNRSVANQDAVTCDNQEIRALNKNEVGDIPPEEIVNDPTRSGSPLESESVTACGKVHGTLPVRDLPETSRDLDDELEAPRALEDETSIVSVNEEHVNQVSMDQGVVSETTFSDPTPDEVTSPLISQVVERRAEVIHIGDSDDDDNRNSGTERIDKGVGEGKGPVLGKGKAKRRAEDTNLGRELRAKTPRTSFGLLRRTGSQQYPIELGSDSDGELPTQYRACTRARPNVVSGTTADEPIVISTDVALLDDTSISAEFSSDTGKEQTVSEDTETLGIDNSTRSGIFRDSSTPAASYESSNQPATSAATTDDPRALSLQEPNNEVVQGWFMDTEGGARQGDVLPNSTNGSNKTKDGFVLSEGQLHVLDQVMNHKKNVFFTGSAGTGKSVLLSELIYRLRARNSRWVNSDDQDSLANGFVAVTASTGIAACNIGGCTLHSFAGIGLGQDWFPALSAKLKKNRQATLRWKQTRVLIVDEISMIDAELLGKLEHLARHIRKNHRPWGGIQVVLCGDFFQLPPVDRSGRAKFCFEAECWSKAIDVSIQLDHVFRQKDCSFASMLNQMRIGRMSSATIRCFRSLTRPIQQDDGIKPTELFPLRKQVEEANMSVLRKLEGDSLYFEARDYGVEKGKMETHCVAPAKLEIKVNAQVMLLRNQSGSCGLANGSIGTVVRFTDKPADNVRARTGPEGEPLPSLNKSGELLPVVRFATGMGGATEMVVGREEWTLEMPGGRILAARSQIPLCLAWALSIHKSQGQTLQKVRVDLGKTFERGQAYVALSRATTLEGLQVLNFDPQKVMVHPKVIEFYSRLGHVEKPGGSATDRCE